MLWFMGSQRVRHSRLMGSAVVAHGLDAPRHVESSGPEIDHVSPALASEFLTTGPPGKS